MVNTQLLLKLILQQLIIIQSNAYPFVSLDQKKRFLWDLVEEYIKRKEENYYG